MPLVQVTKAKRKKTNSRGRRPSKARDEALQDHMENAFSFAWQTGVKRVRGRASTQAMADAYYGKDYAGVMVAIPFENFDKELTEAVEELANATKLGGEVASRQVPNLNELRYDLRNPRIQDYLESRTGALISGVTDDFQVSVQDMIKTRFGQGPTGTTLDLQNQIEPMLRATIGLDPVSAQALRNAAASGKYSEVELKQYEDRLFTRRADNIARTEVAYAVNEGQMAVWQASIDQGLMSEDAMKVWVAEANPCHLCEPLDGVMVPFGENFLSPDGVQVSSPPLHPRCRCQMQLQAAPGSEVPGSGVENYNPIQV